MKKNWFYIVLLLSLTVIYWPTLSAPQNVDNDAAQVLPLLKVYLASPWNYLRDLCAFRLLDFQPVRDFTLLIDLFFFENWKLNTAVEQNLIYWFLICVLLRQLVYRTYPRLSPGTIDFVVLLFAIYPLFGQSINWGMARKHIISTGMILLATISVVDKQRLNLKGLLALSLSLMAQPIAILWPVWTQFYLWLNGATRSSHLSVIPGYIICFATSVVNYLYYTTSKTYLANYQSKLDSGIEVADLLLASGHYFYQLIFPYQLVFNYQLNHWSVLVGLLALALFVLYLVKYHRTKQVLQWTTFTVFPLIIVLVNPHVLYDTYLLIPGIGFFMTLLALWENHNWRATKFATALAMTATVIWIVRGHSESQMWTDPTRYYVEKTFERRPDCGSALRALYIEEKIVPSVREFAFSNNCLQMLVNNPLQRSRGVFLRTVMLYHDDEFAPEQKIKLLEGLSFQNVYAKLILALIFYEQGRFGLANPMFQRDVTKLPKGYGDYPVYDYLVADKLMPYCEKYQNYDCLKLAKPYSRGEPRPYFD